MKNKIFELYKPKSLADFLQFKKENPKEKDLTKPFGNDITYYEDRN